MHNMGVPRDAAMGTNVGAPPPHEEGDAIGVGSINNVVDATNYVLHEAGTPLHAFDLDQMRGAEVRVRQAFPGERMTTLDGVERSLDPADLVDLYEVRAPLEARAAGLAAARIAPADLALLEATCERVESLTGNSARTIDTLIATNEDFHRILIEAAGSPRLSAALRTVAGIPRPFKTVFWNDASARARSLAAHREIIAGLRAGSSDRAESAMRLHVLNARDFLTEVMRERD